MKKTFSVGKPIPREQLRFIKGGDDPASSTICDDSGEYLCKVTTVFVGGGVNRGVGCATDGYSCADKTFQTYAAQGIPTSMIASVTCSC